MRGRLFSLGVLGCSLVLFADVARAQDGYEPIPTVCAELSGDVTIRDGRIEVQFEGRLTISGGPGCAFPGEGVASTVRSDPVLLGQTTAAADGSYAISARLPSSVLPGDHTVVVDFGEGRAQVVRPITVVHATQVLGTTATASPAGTGAQLPRTGGDLAMLVVWGLVLVATGTLLASSARRRLTVRAGGVVATGRRRRSSSRVRRIDTSGFTPSVAERAPRDRDTPR